MTPVKRSMDEVIVVPEAVLAGGVAMDPPQVHGFGDVLGHDVPLHCGHPEIQVGPAASEDILLRVTADVLPQSSSDHPRGLRVEVHGAWWWQGNGIPKELHALSEQLPVGQDPVGLGRGIERCPDPAEEIWRQSIIRIQSHDQLAASDPNPGVPRRGLAAIQWVPGDADPGVAHSLDQLFDVQLARGIVDDDRLPFAHRLIDDTLEAIIEEPLRLIMTRDHDRESGSLLLLERRHRSWPRHAESLAIGFVRSLGWSIQRMRRFLWY
jgi:hypothetical protein